MYFEGIKIDEVIARHCTGCFDVRSGDKYFRIQGARLIEELWRKSK